MKLPRKQAAVVRDAIERWKRNGIIPDEQAATLAGTIEVQYFDWRKLAKYSFWIALFSIITSVSAALSDRVLQDLLEVLFNAPALLKCAVLSLAAAGLYRLGLAKRGQDPGKVYRNEAILFLGVLTTAGAVTQLGVALDTGSGHYSLLLLLSFIVYAVLGVMLESNLIWVFALAALGGWMGTETGYLSGWGAYYLGMNYPLRFVLFGALLTGCALALEHQPIASRFYRSTLVMGLLYLFIALWILSIFGNYGDMTAWERVKHLSWPAARQRRHQRFRPDVPRHQSLYALFRTFLGRPAQGHLLCAAGRQFLVHRQQSGNDLESWETGWGGSGKSRPDSLISRLQESSRQLDDVANQVSRECCVIAAYKYRRRKRVPHVLKKPTTALQQINELPPASLYDKLRTTLPYQETRNYQEKVTTYRKSYVLAGTSAR